MGSKLADWLKVHFDVPEVNFVAHPAAALSILAPFVPAASGIATAITAITALTGAAPTASTVTSPATVGLTSAPAQTVTTTTVATLPTFTELEETLLTEFVKIAITEAEAGFAAIIYKFDSNQTAANAAATELAAKFLVPALMAAEGVVARDEPSLSSTFNAGVAAGENAAGLG